MKLKGTKTLENLVRAYATETQDGARYQFLRQQAMEQQLNYVSNMLKILATNEMAHAKVWWSLITENDQDSYKNVELDAGFPFETGEFVEQFAIVAEVEAKEGSKLYKEFASVARKEGFEDIARKFDMTAAVELQHSSILTQLYEGLNDGSLYEGESVEKWKCTKCGFIGSAKTAWDICPLCAVPQGYAEGQIALK